MSRSPTERSATPTPPTPLPSSAGISGSAGAAWRQRWRRARGQRGRHLLYTHATGVVSWRLDAAAEPEDAKTLADWCARHAHTDVELRMAGELIHTLVVDPALNLRGVDSVRRYARQQFTHYHGADAAAWPLAVWAMDGQSVVCAAHGIDLDAARADAARHGVQLRSACPAWSAGLRSLSGWQPAFAGAGRHALLLVEVNTATWLVVQDARIVSLSQRYLETGRDDAIAELLARLLAESPPLSEPPVVIGWGAGCAPSLSHATTSVRARLGDSMRSDWMLDRIAAPL